MVVEAIILELNRRGIRIQADGDRLIVEGALTDQDRDTLRSHKPEIIRSLEIFNRAASYVTRACEGLPLSPEQFMAEMTTPDNIDIVEGKISAETLRAYAESVSQRLHGRPPH